MSTMSREQLQAKIDSFRYWHYPFDLGEGVAITPTHGWPDAARELRDFIWPRVVDRCGRDLKGFRVLDVGCNAGFWALEAHRSGAAYVLGVDPSSEAIEQATLVRDALKVDSRQVEYREMGVYDLSRERVGVFDLCLFFRVLHHLSHPLLALERLRDVCRAYIAIDVSLSTHSGEVLELHTYDPTEPFCGVGSGLALKPSRAAMVPLMSGSGFTDLQFVPPEPPFSMKQYYAGTRAVFTSRVRTHSDATT